MEGNLLYTWRGKHSERPLVLAGRWDSSPAVIPCFFQAAKELCAEDFLPEQDIYFSLAENEEGCLKLAQEMEKREVKPFLFICSGGGSIRSEPLPHLPGSFAMVGIQEKGHGNLKILARAPGGRFGYPPIVLLSKFMADLSSHGALKASIDPQAKVMFQKLAPYGPFWMRLFFDNLWLFGPFLKHLVSAVSPQAGRLLLHSTLAPVQSGPEAYHVLPQEASLNLTLSYLPQPGMEESNALIKKSAEKYGLALEVESAYPASQSVDPQSEAFQLVQDVIEEVFPQLPVIPSVTEESWDAHYYHSLCPACIRFCPFQGKDVADRSADTSDLPGAVDTYKALMKTIH